jgi:hypothetical protein
LRFGDLRVLALLGALLVFRLLPRGFSNRDLREHVAPLRGMAPEEFSAERMTYDLRCLRLHGLIRRVPGSHRYQLTDFRRNAAIFLSRAYARLIQPGLASAPGDSLGYPARAHALASPDGVIDRIWEDAA